MQTTLPDPRIVSHYEAMLSAACRRMNSSPTFVIDHVVAAARRMLVRDPSHKDACVVVAAASLRDHDASQCAERLVGILSRNGDDALPLRIAGYAYADLDQLELAERHLSAAVRIDPHLSDCWFKLGHIHQHTGEHHSAIAHYRRGLVFEVHEHDCALALSRLLMRRNNVRAAISTLHSALSRDRRSPTLNTELAKILDRRADRLRRRRHLLASEMVLSGAADCYRIAAESQGSARAYLALGIAEQRLGRFTASGVSFRKAAELEPRNTRALMLLASQNMDNGDIQRAVQDYERVIAINPRNAEAHFRYSRSRKFVQEPATTLYVEQLAQLLADERPAVDRMHLHFAIAKVLDDSGDYDRAWTHYDLANRLKPSHSESASNHRKRDPEKALKAMVDDPIAFFTPDYFRASHVGSESDLPVFIVGMPRSGTTLVEQIISSHPLISGAGELKEMERLRYRLSVADETHLSQSDRPSPEFFSQPRHSYPEVLSSVSSDSLQRLAAQYLQRLELHRGDAIRVTDKMPTNFVHLGLIATLFPNATIIHCRRNPMDVFVSSYCQNLSAPFCDLNALVGYYRGYQRLMQHWYSVLPQHIHTVDYETLVENPETESRKLIASCGLNWDEQCLNFNRNERAVRTPSKWQVRQPMYSSSVNRWKRFEHQLEEIALAVGAQ